MAKVIVFGLGDIAQLIKYYLATDSEHEVVAFTVDQQYKTADEFEGKPVVSFDVIADQYPPSAYKMFIALGYSELNKKREEKYVTAKAKGYELISYISSRCSYLSTFDAGDNCLILEDNTIQPYVKIGSNVFMWSGNHIGHHSVIESHNFISSHVVISGHCVVESHCFLGVNITLANNITIANHSLIGAGSIITKNTEPYDVYVPARSVKLNKKSNEINL